MMRWFILLLATLSGPAVAEQINVRSGAHEDFARLVLNIPVGIEWRLEPLAKGARLVLDKHNDGFDISTIFERIDRTFISAVNGDEASLNVEFSCQCTANVFSQGPRMIVMDVSLAGLREEKEPPVRDLEFSFVGQQVLRFDDSEQDVGSKESPSIQNLPTRRLDREVGSTQAIEFSPAATFERIPEPNSTELRVAQATLFEQIGAAATRGILNPTGSTLNLNAVTAQSQIDTRIFDAAVLMQDTDEDDSTLGGNIKVTSSSDIPGVPGDQFQRATSLGFPCVDPDMVAIQNWGSDKGLSHELAILRGQLFGEFDRLDQDVAIRLVKTYLHYGFGAEARQILFLDKNVAKAHQVLSNIAEIMEYGHSRTSTYLEHFADCDSAIALWSILSTLDIDPSTEINSKSALLSLSGLPMHLRSFIAPELSRRFLAYGDEDASAAALRSLERAPQPLSPDANLAKANLEMVQGDIKQAQERLSGVVASNAQQSAEALIHYVDSYLDEDAQIDEEVATLVEAYAMEMRDSAIGDELQRTHVLALGKSDQFSEAFRALARVRVRNAEMSEDALRSSVLDLLTRNASDVEFLDHAFNQMTIAPETISADARFQLAKRLVELGFYEQGETVLVSGSEYSNETEVALLKAEISLALFRPFEAIAHLSGQSSEVSEVMRARAETMAGDFSEAHSIYAAIGDETNSRRTAWLSDDWSVLIEDAAPVFGPVVRVSQSTLENPPESQGMLQRVGAAISESQVARQVIQDLLSSEGPDFVAN